MLTRIPNPGELEAPPLGDCWRPPTQVGPYNAVLAYRLAKLDEARIELLRSTEHYKTQNDNFEAWLCKQ